MTREEAIFTMEYFKLHFAKREAVEAFDMAIKSLEQEPCGDAISRADARHLIAETNRNALGYISTKVFKILYDGIDKLPSVTPQQRKGIWKRMSDFPIDVDDRFECSCCGNVVHHRSVMDLRTFNRWCGRCGSENDYKKEMEE